MRVLVVNAGSSSLKLSALDGDEVADRVATRTIERWQGEGHLEPIRAFLDELGDADGGGATLDAVGHRVVHGGPRFSDSVRVEDEVVDYLASISDLAPLHNPRAVEALRAVGEALPDTPAVACFDTAFHAGLAAAARTYALPREWNEQWGLRRYGFHGLSHSYASHRAAALVARPVEDLRTVSCHLGAGASLAAVRGGRSVDTTMGFTPLEGLVMVTRSGSVDPGLLEWLLRHGDLSRDELFDALMHQGGLKGLSGTSGDLRDVLEGRASGDRDCALAYDVFVHRLVREIGAMVASAGGLDVLLFTGGIGEHSPEVRADVAERLEWLGVGVDPSANERADGDGEITASGARVHTVVVSAAEDVEIAREAHRLLG